MRIGIYNEPPSGALGGSEVSVAVLADALSEHHEVEILHHRTEMTREQLAEFAEADLMRVRLRLIAPPSSFTGAPWRVFSRYRAEKDEEEAVTKDFDVFISFQHETPLFCAAPLGILMVLFPFSTPEGMVRIPPDAPAWSRAIRLRLGGGWHRRKLNRRLQSYRVKLANSEFTRHWTRRRWGIDCQVLYPPIDVDFAPSPKANRILSVGRFATAGHSKKQLELLEVFSRLKELQPSDWSFECVGGCGTGEGEVAFFNKARELGERSGAHVAANLERTDLKRLYQQARIFWHAAGMDVNEESEPQMAEHFGMSTAEAMAAGCVPVVINKGGQREIVQHGVNGFLWNTLAELEEYTRRLMLDPKLFEEMSAAARRRAGDFSREAYVARFRALLP